MRFSCCNGNGVYRFSIQGPRYNFLLEGAMGKPGDELSNPEPWRRSRSTPLEKI